MMFQLHRWGRGLNVSAHVEFALGKATLGVVVVGAGGGDDAHTRESCLAAEVDGSVDQTCAQADMLGCTILFFADG